MSIPFYHSEVFVRRLKNKDIQAFGLLYDRYAHSLLGVIMKSIPQVQLAEEKLEEVFALAFTSIHTLEFSQPSLFPWLFQLAKVTIAKHETVPTAFPWGKPEVWRGAATF